MTYEYKRTEENLWTVGTYSGGGVWGPESDHGSPEEAAERARYLNGGNATVSQSEITLELCDALEWLVNLASGVSKFGGPVNEEWENAWRAAEQILRKAKGVAE